MNRIVDQSNRRTKRAKKKANWRISIMREVFKSAGLKFLYPRDFAFYRTCTVQQHWFEDEHLARYHRRMAAEYAARLARRKLE